MALRTAYKSSFGTSHDAAYVRIMSMSWTKGASSVQCQLAVYASQKAASDGKSAPLQTIVVSLPHEGPEAPTLKQCYAAAKGQIISRDHYDKQVAARRGPMGLGPRPFVVDGPISDA